MAGIGFELKKLFSEEEELPFANLRAIIFSQILTCIFQYIITRYVSDCVFKKKISKIRGAYLGSIKLINLKRNSILKHQLFQ